MFTGFHPHRAKGASQARAWLFRALLAVSLAGAGFADAADEQKPAGERPLDLTLPRAASDASGMRRTGTEMDPAAKPYGSGYEARRLDATRRNPGSPSTSASAPAGALDERAWSSGGGSRAPASAPRGGGAGRGGRR